MFVAYKICLVRHVPWLEKLWYMFLIVVLPMIFGFPLMLIPLDPPVQGSIKENLRYTLGFIGYASVISTGKNNCCSTLHLLFFYLLYLLILFAVLY